MRAAVAEVVVYVAMPTDRHSTFQGQLRSMFFHLLTACLLATSSHRNSLYDLKYYNNTVSANSVHTRLQPHGIVSVLGSETAVLWQDRSQTGLGLSLGLASNTAVHDKTLCDTIMLKCNKHLCSFVP